MAGVEEGYGGLGEDDADEIETPPPSNGRRGPGRPKKNAGAERTVVVTRQEFVGPPEVEEQAPRVSTSSTFAALFGVDGEEEANLDSIIRVRVIRTDPHEGTVGYIEDMNSTEEEILRRWGGSYYRIEGISGRGHIKKVKTIRLAGDPVFKSEAFDIQWRRSVGLPAKPNTPTGSSVSTGNGNVDAIALLEKIQEREDRKRADERKEREEIDERRRVADREWRSEQLKMERDAEDRRRKEEREWEEKRRKDQEESDRLRKREQEEMDVRRRKDELEREERSRSNMQMMVGILQESTKQTVAMIKEVAATNNSGERGSSIEEAMKTIAMVKEVFGGDRADGDDELSPLQMLAKVAPQLMEGLSGAVREIRGQPSLPPVAGRTALPLPPAIAADVERLTMKVAAKGIDPEKFFSQAVKTLEAAVDGKAKPVAPVAAAPKPAPAVAQPAAATDSPKVEEKAKQPVIRLSFGRK